MVKQNNNNNKNRALITEAIFPEVIAKSLHPDLFVEKRTFGPTVRLRFVPLSPWGLIARLTYRCLLAFVLPLTLTSGKQ
jgi:hypothetical protein